MKALIYSDLHLEFPAAQANFRAPQNREFDTVILAGNIHALTHSICWAALTFPGKHVIYVPGNHEYYRAHLNGLLQEMRKVAEELGVHTHDEFDYMLGKCCVSCNPRGYPLAIASTNEPASDGRQARIENAAFGDDLVIEL